MLATDDARATDPSGDTLGGTRRTAAGSESVDAHLRELRRRDGRAQMQAHLPRLRLLPELLRLLLTAT
jgi:hypothetical protein